MEHRCKCSVGYITLDDTDKVERLQSLRGAQNIRITCGEVSCTACHEIIYKFKEWRNQ